MISERDGTMYFSIDEMYAFKLSFRGRDLLKSFVSDYGSGCDNKKFCYWIREMKKFVDSPSNTGLHSILTKAAILYDELKNPNQHVQKNIDQTPLVARTNTSVGPIIADLAKEFINSKILIGSQVLSYENFLMILLIPLNQGQVTVSIRFSYDYPSILPEIQIISPRFKLDGNISFGGTFQVNGLTPYTWQAKSSSFLVDRILQTLKDAVIDNTHQIAKSLPIDYTPVEAKACRGKTQNVTNVGTNIQCFETNDPTINESSFVILPLDYLEMITNQMKGEIQIVKVITLLGLHGYYSPKFADVPAMEMSQLQMINLNLQDGDTVTFLSVPLSEASSITLRPRSQDIYELGGDSDLTFLESLSEHLEYHRVLSVGHTIGIRTNSLKYYIDVVELFDHRHNEVSGATLASSRDYADYQISFLPSLDSQKMDPLAIPEEGYGDDEESDEESEDFGRAVEDED